MANNTQTSWRMLLANKGRELSNITTLAGIIIQQDLNNDTSKWREAISKAFVMRNFNFFGEHVYSVLENFDNIDNLLTVEYEAFYHNTKAALKPQIGMFNSSVENMKKASLRGHRANDNISDRIWNSALEIIGTLRKFLESLRTLENVTIDSNVTKELKSIINEVTMVFRMWKVTGYEEEDNIETKECFKNKESENKKKLKNDEYQNTQCKIEKKNKLEKKVPANKNTNKTENENKKENKNNIETKKTEIDVKSRSLKTINKYDIKNQLKLNSPAIKNTGNKKVDKNSFTTFDVFEYSSESSDTEGEDQKGTIVLRNNFTSSDEDEKETEGFQKVEYKKSKMKKNIWTKNSNEILNNESRELPSLLDLETDPTFQNTEIGKIGSPQEGEDLEKCTGDQGIFFTPTLSNNSLRCGLCNIELHGKRAVVSHLRNRAHLKILFHSIRTSSIPSSVRYRVGVVRNVPVDLSLTDEDLNNFTSTVPIISVRRITKRSEDGVIVPLSMLEIKFLGNVLPTEVRFYGIVLCEVEPSIRNIVRCIKCLRSGHARELCKCSKRCF